MGGLFACNSVLRQTGQPLVQAPYPLLKPANLPLLNAAITFVGVHPAPSIVLIPQSDAPYPEGPTLAVWASPPAPQGNGQSAPNKWRARAYFFLGLVDGGVPSDGIQVTELYTGVFGTVPASCKIGFKVMAINPGGYHSEPVYTFGLSPLPTASALAAGHTKE